MTFHSTPTLHVGHFSVMHPKLAALLPVDKHDTAKLAEIVRLGYPEVEPLVPDLLGWLQDGNWPIAKQLSPFLASIGLPLAPHIRTVLSGEDGIWKYWVLCTVVKASPELRRELHSDLERIAQRPSRDESAEEVDLYAQELLAGTE